MFRRWTDYKSEAIQKGKNYEVVYKYTNSVIYKGKIEGDCFAGGTIEHVKSVSFDEIKPLIAVWCRQKTSSGEEWVVFHDKSLDRIEVFNDQWVWRGSEYITYVKGGVNRRKLREGLMGKSYEDGVKCVEDLLKDADWFCEETDGGRLYKYHYKDVETEMKDGVWKVKQTIDDETYDGAAKPVKEGEGFVFVKEGQGTWKKKDSTWTGAWEDGQFVEGRVVFKGQDLTVQNVHRKGECFEGEMDMGDDVAYRIRFTAKLEIKRRWFLKGGECFMKYKDDDNPNCFSFVYCSDGLRYEGKVKKGNYTCKNLPAVINEGDVYQIEDGVKVYQGDLLLVDECFREWQRETSRVLSKKRNSNSLSYLKWYGVMMTWHINPNTNKETTIKDAREITGSKEIKDAREIKDGKWVYLPDGYGEYFMKGSERTLYMYGFTKKELLSQFQEDMHKTWMLTEMSMDQNSRELTVRDLDGRLVFKGIRDYNYKPESGEVHMWLEGRDNVIRDYDEKKKDKVYEVYEVESDKKVYAGQMNIVFEESKYVVECSGLGTRYNDDNSTTSGIFRGLNYIETGENRNKRGNWMKRGRFDADMFTGIAKQKNGIMVYFKGHEMWKLKQEDGVFKKQELKNGSLYNSDERIYCFRGIDEDGRVVEKTVVLGQKDTIEFKENGVVITRQGLEKPEEYFLRQVKKTFSPHRMRRYREEEKKEEKEEKKEEKKEEEEEEEMAGSVDYEAHPELSEPPREKRMNQIETSPRKEEEVHWETPEPQYSITSRGKIPAPSSPNPSPPEPDNDVNPALIEERVREVNQVLSTVAGDLRKMLFGQGVDDDVLRARREQLDGIEDQVKVFVIEEYSLLDDIISNYEEKKPLSDEVVDRFVTHFLSYTVC